ncbi:hypothetical protein BKA69DRAFT_111949 [Paraphysoderma sedebokerense]|nr:hypothetical protein BKA69DRAFT_111949 [Paraphysoderma sedebokerense]
MSVLATGSLPEIAGATGFLTGVGVVLAASIMTSPQLRTFQNKMVYHCLIIGPIACLVYLFTGLHAWSQVQFTPEVLFIISLSWTASSFCVSVILSERTIPLLNLKRKLSSGKIKIVELVIPIILSIPQLISLGYQLAYLPSFAPQFIWDSAIPFLGILCSCSADLGLSVLFLHILVKNRNKSTILEVFKENKRGVLMLTLAFFLALTKITESLVTGFIIPKLSNYRPWWFIGAFTYITPLIHLLAFDNYIYLTKIASREILKQSITTHGTSPQIATSKKTTTTQNP